MEMELRLQIQVNEYPNMEWFNRQIYIYIIDKQLKTIMNV